MGPQCGLRLGQNAPLTLNSNCTVFNWNSPHSQINTTLRTRIGNTRDHNLKAQGEATEKKNNTVELGYNGIYGTNHLLCNNRVYG